MPINPMAGGNVIAAPRTPNQPVVAAFPEHQGPAVLPGHVGSCSPDPTQYLFAIEQLANIYDVEIDREDQIKILISVSKILGIEMDQRRAGFYAAKQVKLMGLVNQLSNLLAERTQDASVREQSSNPAEKVKQNLAGLFEESARNDERKAMRELAKRINWNNGVGSPVCGYFGGPGR